MTIITTHPIIDFILESQKTALEKDYDRYRNHVYRLYHLSLDLYKDELTQKTKDKFAIAAAFHDLGIWTAKTFDYLSPSIHLAQTYLVDNKLDEWTEEISLLIDMHHKMSTYKGPFQESVEAFRRGDWIEVTLGFKHYDVSPSLRKELKKTFPNLGFHWFLVKQTLKQLFRSPLNPLPMFRK